MVRVGAVGPLPAARGASVSCAPFCGGAIHATKCPWGVGRATLPSVSSTLTSPLTLVAMTPSEIGRLISSCATASVCTFALVRAHMRRPDDTKRPGPSDGGKPGPHIPYTPEALKHLKNPPVYDVYYPDRLKFSMKFFALDVFRHFEEDGPAILRLEENVDAICQRVREEPRVHPQETFERVWRESSELLLQLLKEEERQLGPAAEGVRGLIDIKTLESLLKDYPTRDPPKVFGFPKAEQPLLTRAMGFIRHVFGGESDSSA